jgi:PAS domain S-box-containing protein
LAKDIDRLIELDEQEFAKRHDRLELFTLMGAVIEAFPQALIVTDSDGRIVLFNEEAEFMFGYHRSEMIGRPVERLMPDCIREVHVRHREAYNRFDIDPHARAMGLGRPLTGMRSDGQEFPVDITLARMVIPRGVYNLALVRHAHPVALPPIAITRPAQPDHETKEPNAGH